MCVFLFLGHISHNVFPKSSDTKNKKRYMKGTVICMANIQWTSSSINSFFQTSLNQKNTTGFNSMYSLLGEASMIRSGGYYKLMDAYYKEVAAQKAENTKSDDAKSANTDSSKTDDTKTTTSKLSDSYTSYNSNGVKTQNSTSILDRLI